MSIFTPTINTLKRTVSYGILILVVTIILKVIPMHYKFVIMDIPGNDLIHTIYYKSVVFTLDVIADSNDTVTFIVDSHGGSVVRGFDIVNSILETDAKTIGYIKSGAYSMGAIIITACDEIQAAKYSGILFHKARYRSKSGIVIVNEPMVDDFIKDRVYKNLTKKEIKGFENGEDISMTGQEFISRLKKGDK